MRSSHFEVLVPLPHLVAIHRLPAEVAAGGVTVSLTGAATAADIVGTLRAHVAEATWQWGRRTGEARVEVMRTHVDRSAVTVTLDGLPIGTAAAVAGELRLVLAATPAAAAPATSLAPDRQAARPA